MRFSIALLLVVALILLISAIVLKTVATILFYHDPEGDVLLSLAAMMILITLAPGAIIMSFGESCKKIGGFSLFVSAIHLVAFFATVVSNMPLPDIFYQPSPFAIGLELLGVCLTAMSLFLMKPVFQELYREFKES